MRKQLISTCYYALNNSNSKSIALGVDIIDDKFEPVIKLISAKQSDLTIRHKTWQKLCGYFDQIEAYLTHRPYNLDHRTPVDEVTIVLTSSFGEPSLLIEQTTPVSVEEPTTAIGVAPTSAQSAGPLSFYLSNAVSGKSFTRPFVPGVIFQLTSFEGLRKSKVCVDLRLQQLKENLVAMQIVVDTLVSELQQRLVNVNCEYLRWLKIKRERSAT